MVGMILVFLALVGCGFGSGLFLRNPKKVVGYPNNAQANGNAAAPGNEGQSDSSEKATFVSVTTLVNRQDYNYNIVTMLGLPTLMKRTSSQAQALEWLAFEDEPLFDPRMIASEDEENIRNVLA